MSAGKVAVTFILSLITGAVLGVAVYNHYYQLSEDVLVKYDLIFLIMPSLTMFVVGYFVGGRGKSTEFTYRPMFQGQPQQLGKDGERIMMVALQRAGIVREKR